MCNQLAFNLSISQLFIMLIEILELLLALKSERITNTSQNLY